MKRNEPVSPTISTYESQVPEWMILQSRATLAWRARVQAAARVTQSIRESLERQGTERCMCGVIPKESGDA